MPVHKPGAIGPVNDAGDGGARNAEQLCDVAVPQRARVLADQEQQTGDFEVDLDTAGAEFGRGDVTSQRRLEE
jgi:hypothetical protein